MKKAIEANNQKSKDLYEDKDNLSQINVCQKLVVEQEKEIEQVAWITSENINVLWKLMKPIQEVKLQLKNGVKLFTASGVKLTMARVLVVGDTHCPVMMDGYEFLSEMIDWWDCDRIVHIGDLVDWASMLTIKRHQA